MTPKRRRPKLGKVQQAAIEALYKAGGLTKSIPTSEIKQYSRANITVSTLNSLEKLNIVSKAGVYYFNKPFEKISRKPIDYAELPRYAKEDIIWQRNAKSYSWILTPSGFKRRKIQDN